MWGFNLYDQLGIGEKQEDHSLPVRVKGPDNIYNKVVCGYYHTAAYT